MNRIFTAGLALALAAGIGGAVLAAGTADELISARQAEMKSNTKAIKALVSIVKGETAYDNAAVQAAVKILVDAREESKTKDVWSASAQQGETVKTGAKPEVWSDAAGFAAAWTQFDAAVAGIAASTDKASFEAAFPALGASCKACHEKFRAAE